ncbi:hypothetical protein F5146DRAFT_1144587 [Armillaria mellea]|nr:hypothetical protein F5146DRAFT_1144587 [Armillaria mellea]
MLFAPSGEILPNLSELKNLTIPSLKNIPFWDYPAFWNAPKLTSLSFDGLHVSQLYSARTSLFPRTQITVLRIDKCPYLYSLFEALIAFPNIRDLTVNIDRPHTIRAGFPQTIRRPPESNLISRITWNLSRTSFVPQPFGGLRFPTLNSLLMKYHASFDEEDDDYSSIGVDLILNVVSSAASKLQHVTFSAIPISGMEIISTLQILPRLVSLVIHDPNPNDCELPEAPSHLLYPIDEHLLQQLTASPAGLPFLASLNSIELVWTENIDEGAVMDMIESRRWCEASLERATLGKLEPHVNLAPTTHQRLRDLRKGGLAFSKEWNTA